MIGRTRTMAPVPGLARVSDGGRFVSRFGSGCLAFLLFDDIEKHRGPGGHQVLGKFFLVYYTVSRQVDGENAERIPPGSAEHRPRLVDLLGGHAENRESRGQIG